MMAHRSIEKVLDQLLELSEVDLASALGVNLIEGGLQRVLVQVIGLAQEHVQLVNRDHLVLVDVELAENRLEALLSEELLLVDANHHEFLEGDEAVP